MPRKNIQKMTLRSEKIMEKLKRKKPSQAKDSEKSGVGVFIDAANTDISLKRIGVKLSIPKTMRFIRRAFGKIAFARYYTIKGGNQTHFRIMEGCGISVFQKEPKMIGTKKGALLKCDLDPEIITDITLNNHKYDTIVLFSGDSDFFYTLKELKSIGKKIIVVSAGFSVSDELIGIADELIDLEKNWQRLSK